MSYRYRWLVLVFVLATPFQLHGQASVDTARIADPTATAGVEQVRLRLGDLLARVDRQTAVSTGPLARELQAKREALTTSVRQSAALMSDRQTTRLQAAVDSLETQLRIREDENAHLQIAVAGLVDEIHSLREVHVVDAELGARADSLAAVVAQAARDLELWTVGELYGHVRAWSDLGLTLRAITLTAQNLLLFPEDQSSRFDKALRTVGVMGVLAGALVATSDPGVGATTSGLSVLASQVPSWFGGDRTSRLMESVARNRSFTDDILAFARIATPFAESARALQRELPTPEEARHTGLPKESLAKYVGLVSQRRDLSVITRQMRAKTEYLLSLDSLSEVGRASLEGLLGSYDQALAHWESSEESYTATFRFLSERAADREG